jgi:hypothetical protein
VRICSIKGLLPRTRSQTLRFLLHSLLLQTYTSIFAAADLIQFGTPTVPFTWDNFITNLRAGTLYVNIHTTDAPTGLIRGQLLSARGGIRTATFGGGFLFPGRCGLSPWWRP